MSFLSQMLSLTFQNFVSAAVGFAVAFALIRGIARRDLKKGLGNFYTDLIRSTLYVLIPLSVIFALFLVSQGVPQTFTGSVQAHTLEGGVQVIDLGPVASQEAIKLLGTNGGGFYNVNSAHPFENPTTLTNFVEMFSILILPRAFIFAFGMMVLHPRHGKTLWIVIALILVLGIVFCVAAEQAGNPVFAKAGVNSDGTPFQAGGNMEGKEVRFGVYGSATFAVFTTGASCGAVNSMHDSYMPLGGMVPMLLIMLGELIFGGVGAGLYSLIILVVLTIFLAGLMVGRTPEYLGKKISGYDVKMVMIAVMIAEVSILVFSGIAMSLDRGLAAIFNPGPHGLSEVLYAYASSVGNNGSAFAGLGTADQFYTLTQALAMFVGRYLYIVAVLGLAGSLAKKKIHPDTGAAFPVDGTLFGALLPGVIVIVAALTFFPTLVLGPILEHVLLSGGGRVTQAAATRREARKGKGLLDGPLVREAVAQSFVKLDPRVQIRTPVMFVVLVGALAVTIAMIADGLAGRPIKFTFQIALWLWFTVLFANFAEAVAEGRGKAQAESLRKTKTETMARKLDGAGSVLEVPASSLRKGDLVLVEAGDVIPADGTVEWGVATVDESAITGESAPVVRESGGDRSAVTGGTRVTSDRIKVRVTVNPGEGFIDKMIALVEGAKRQKAPNEIALSILISGLTIIFLSAVVTLAPFAAYVNSPVSLTVLVALLVCLIPTTIGALLSAIGIAGMDRLLRANVVAKSGKAVEAAGDIDVILLDKTGTITFGNRQAHAFLPAPGVSEKALREVAMLSSLSDDTPEGKSIVVLAKREGSNPPELPPDVVVVPFTAQTRMSGLTFPNGREIRKGAPDSITEHVRSKGGSVPSETLADVRRVSTEGGTPLLVCDGQRLLGVVYLKDIVKPGIADRLRLLRRMGLRTVMVTGDNLLTVQTIAQEAAVDDFIAEAKPEDKLRFIEEEQEKGHLVAMIGDGTNDAPALAQSDVGVAMNTGTQAAREAGNMVDLDSSPTKLIDVIEIGKQLLITRGALTTFSVANDVAKYFAILPAMFVVTYPGLAALNIMRLHSPQSAILSAVIFNALIIALIPIALRGVLYRPTSAEAILRRNLLIYGLGGILAPFIGIKLIDLVITAVGLG